MLEYQYIKTFLQKAMFQSVLKKFLRSKKLKTPFREHMLLVIVKAKKLLECFTKKNCKKKKKKQIKRSVELKK